MSPVSSRQRANLPVASTRLRIYSSALVSVLMVHSWPSESESSNKTAQTTAKPSRFVYCSSNLRCSASFTNIWVAFMTRLVDLASRYNLLSYHKHPYYRSSVIFFVVGWVLVPDSTSSCSGVSTSCPCWVEVSIVLGSPLLKILLSGATMQAKFRDQPLLYVA